MGDKRIRNRIVNGNQGLIRPALGDIGLAESIEVPIPAEAEIHGQSGRYLPIILTVKAKLLGGNQEVRIAVRDRHAADQARSRKTVRVNGRSATWGARVDSHAQNAARIRIEVDFQS